MGRSDPSWAADARHWQIGALSALWLYSFTALDFGVRAVPSLVAVAVCLLTQALCARLWRRPVDLRSPLITALSLSLLLRVDGWWIMALAACVGIAGKFVLRWGPKQIWNPSALGIVAALFLTRGAWVSPGQWGASAWCVALIGLLALLVLGRATRWDTALAFLSSHAGLLLARALWLGDPLTIPIHQLESGSLLLFAFFMVTDPRTTPDRPAARILFAAAVAALAHGLAFFAQLRPALYVALVGLAPLVPLLDRIFPSEPFRWPRAAAGLPLRSMLMAILQSRLSRAARAASIGLAVTGAFAAALTPAAAFCGFYVAQADSRLFNKASKVVLVREGQRTTITMASDYQGDPQEFALVVPVPVVVAKSDIHVVEPGVIEKLDGYTAPRLTEYYDEDPCRPRPMTVYAPAAPAPAGAAAEMARAGHGVTIEARYEVGVYDILILSAEESDGLVAWLQENQYRIPPGAEEVLGSYIRQSMHFFVAKVNLKRQAAAGGGFLKPIEVGYQSARFMLPLRLGTVNAAGPQDLVLFTLTQGGRVEAANYKPAKMRTRVDVPLFTRDELGPIYKAAFDRAVERDGMSAVYLEYAWPLGRYCDPCSGTPPDESDLATLGADRSGGLFITRLHVRYDRAHFPEDLTLTETRDTEPFQVVYAMHHPFTGPSSCRAGDDYVRALPDRYAREAENLADLTGWKLAEIRRKMAETGEDSRIRPPGLLERLLR